jgi:hypothetical protein
MKAAMTRYAGAGIRASRTVIIVAAQTVRFATIAIIFERDRVLSLT